MLHFWTFEKIFSLLNCKEHSLIFNIRDIKGRLQFPLSYIFPLHYLLHAPLSKPSTLTTCPLRVYCLFYIPLFYITLPPSLLQGYPLFLYLFYHSHLSPHHIFSFFSAAVAALLPCLHLFFLFTHRLILLFLSPPFFLLLCTRNYVILYYICIYLYYCIISSFFSHHIFCIHLFALPSSISIPFLLPYHPHHRINLIPLYLLTYFLFASILSIHPVYCIRHTDFNFLCLALNLLYPLFSLNIFT
jgi:hypothetical protein